MSATWKIRPARETDLSAAAALAARMWEHPAQELREDFAGLLNSADAAIFVADQGGRVVGFAQCQLRRDYVEGTKTSPVGYLEGVFVDEACRRQGIAKALLAACEAWAEGLGCTEFASDCELCNADSIGFHGRVGFSEAKRIVCFVKTLKKEP